MKELLRIFPNSYADLPVSELYCGIRIFSDTQQPDGALVAEGEELMQLRNQKADELKKQEEENQYRRRPRRDGEGAWKWRWIRFILLFILLVHLYYYMRNFCNLIGLEQWYFNLIWNTYIWKLQNLCG